MASIEGDPAVAKFAGVSTGTVARWRREHGYHAARYDPAMRAYHATPPRRPRNSKGVMPAPHDIPTDTTEWMNHTPVEMFVAHRAHSAMNTLSETSKQWADLTIAKRVVADNRNRWVRFLDSVIAVTEGEGAENAENGEIAVFDSEGREWAVSASKRYKNWRKELASPLAARVLEHLSGMPDVDAVIAEGRRLTRAGTYSISGMRSVGIDPYEKNGDGWRFLEAYKAGDSLAVVPDPFLGQQQEIDRVVLELQGYGFSSRTAGARLGSVEAIVDCAVSAYNAEQTIRKEISRHEAGVISGSGFPRGRPPRELKGRGRRVYGRVLRSGGYKRGWKHDEVFTELKEVSRGIPYQAAKRFIEMHAFLPWKKTGMAEWLGVDIEKYMRVTDASLKFAPVG